MQRTKYIYSVSQGVQKLKSRTAIIITALTMAASGGGAAAVVLSGTAHAAPGSSTTTQQFTPTYVGGFVPDRTAPSGTFGSVSFEGRNNVLELNVNGANRTATDSWYFTEGLKDNAISGAVSAKADLYVSNSWLATSVRAGLWGVGSDNTGAISAYPIVEFTTAGDGGYVGWRIFNDEVGGWTNLTNVPYHTDSWNTVGFTLNPTTKVFDFTVNGHPAGSSVATGSVNLSSLIFNNYNYGPTSTNYSVHWSNLVTGQNVTANKESCKNNGWAGLTLTDGSSFKNQGACVSYFASGSKS